MYTLVLVLKINDGDLFDKFFFEIIDFVRLDVYSPTRFELTLLYNDSTHFHYCGKRSLASDVIN